MSQTMLAYRGILPRRADSAFVAPTARLIGDVEIGPESSVWFGCTVRADVNFVHIDARTNIQDGTVIPVDSRCHPTIIGDGVTIGHMALNHACTFESGGFVGMNATVMDGAVVEGGRHGRSGGAGHSGQTRPRRRDMVRAASPFSSRLERSRTG